MTARTTIALLSIAVTAGTVMARAPQAPNGQAPNGQDKPAAAAAPAQNPAQNKGQTTPAKENLGPAADTIHPYRPAGHDPFKRIVAPKAGKNKNTTRALGFPSLEARRTDFQQRTQKASRAGLPDPDPFSQYLVSELEVMGVFSDSRGPGAFVRAQPTGTTFFARRGARCYNGELLRIEADQADAQGTRVVFKETFYSETNGKQVQQDRVVAKSAPGR